MANNDLSNVVPQLLAQGLMVLRQNCVMPRLVNSTYETNPGTQGSTIDVPISVAIAATAVTPAITPPANAGVTPGTIAVALDQWYEGVFYMTDKERTEVMRGHIPKQAEEAVKGVANNVDQYLLALYKKVYGYASESVFGATEDQLPFEDTSGLPSNTKVAARARTVLNKQLAPLSPRYVVMNPDTEGAALSLRAFQDVSWSTDVGAILEGQLNRKLGMQWFMNQNVDVAAAHTAGTASVDTDVIAVDNGAGYPIGTKTINADVAAATSTFVVGDVFKFANHSQTYVCTNAGTLDITGVNLSFEPGLVAAVVDDEAITFAESHTANLVFHRDAIAFATKPLPRSETAIAMETVVDTISGLTLRLEVSRQHKQDRWSFDVLYGANMVDPRLACRLASPIA